MLIPLMTELKITKVGGLQWNDVHTVLHKSCSGSSCDTGVCILIRETDRHTAC
jgi:hypothetical protein